jgi:diguanylate cyclase (GGDEF)-like protein/PAS domain S-box-containing protein
VADADDLAERWTRALVRTAYSPTARSVTTALLAAHLSALVRALTARQLVTEAAVEVGDWMVRARFTGPGSLPATVDLLGPALLALPELAHVADLPQRVAVTTGAIGAGYAHALRQQVFREQEDVRQSLLQTVRQAQRDLHDSETRFGQVFAASRAGIAVLDLEGTLVEANPALVDMLGRGPGDPLVPADTEPLRAECLRLRADGADSARTELEFLRHDGESLWAQVSVSVVRDSDGVPAYLIAVVDDETEQRMLREYLRHQALHDVLTGLPNRQSFEPALERALARLAPGAAVLLCYLDVDGLAIVNDGLGYAAGDAVLVAVASRLRDAVAGHGAVVARLGGDEFVVLVEETGSSSRIDELAGAIDRELAEPVHLDGRGVSVTASMGFARAERGTHPLVLLRRAHSTLRRAERDGTRQWAIHDREADAVEQPITAMVAAMPGALENGEIELCRAPLVRLADGERVACEVRLRWEAAGRVVEHDECVRAAGELGLTARLSEWVLREACGYAVPRGAPVLAHLSPQESRDPDLVSLVTTVLAETGLPAELLWLGLDVHGLRRRPEVAEDNLAVLADLGVRTVLHGVGGGLDDLSCVDRLAPGHVKLLPPGRRELVRTGFASLVALLRSTGAKVITDSTAADADWFRGVGVDLAVLRG